MKNMTFILYPEGITLILKQHLGGFTSPEDFKWRGIDWASMTPDGKEISDCDYNLLTWVI